jgi:hypothetical protein
MSRDPEIITVTDLRVATREIIENAHFRGRRYVVERAGHAMVVVLGIEEYNYLIKRVKPTAADDMELSGMADHTASAHGRVLTA